MSLRLPAEWEPQSAVLLTWPHKDSDWQYLLAEVEAFYIQLANKLNAYTTVLIVAPIGSSQAITAALGQGNFLIQEVPSNDTWARDHGPITVLKDHKPKLLDFIFTGWGGKFEASLDNQITRQLFDQSVFGDCDLSSVPFILEGGAIESDGDGTLLTTEACLLNPNRNTAFSRADVETKLRQTLGVQHILWLQHGHLVGDDTDSHIDTLARLCPNHTITYVQCSDSGDEHYDAIRAMEYELATLKTANGEAYNLIPLPMPKAIYDPDDGRRLPATYANFLVCNGAVFVPTYADPMDKLALSQIQKAFPEHTIIDIDCNVLIRQNGSLHCITMQLPKGVISK